ncbi:hypothetical protein V2G26_009045 [Clonostachys chloroleuca]
MGYRDHRRKQLDQSADQKWDYINLNDFKARGCGPGFAYFWLWLLLFISVAVYALDSFTAVNLLILNQWSSKIQPGIPFQYSKWIFSGCILLSFINFAYEAWRAVRVIKRNNVAESYLDPLAVRWESIRMGSGQGWKRFLVFAELTKGQKGAEYAALFTYFSLQSWIRVLICSGPRQVINAFTFRDVYVSKLDVSDQNAGNGFLKFWEKIGALANEDYQQALILGAMAFTFVVWVFTLIFFLTAVVIYFTFLCHWIPKADGGLVGYCERKVNSRLKKVVTAKVNRALAKGQQQLMKEEYVTVQKGDKPVLQRVATLPTLPNVGPISPDALPTMPSLQRSDTVTYSESSEGIEMTNSIGHNRPVPSRSGTGQSRTPSLMQLLRWVKVHHFRPSNRLLAVLRFSQTIADIVDMTRGLHHHRSEDTTHHPQRHPTRRTRPIILPRTPVQPHPHTELNRTSTPTATMVEIARRPPADTAALWHPSTNPYNLIPPP